MDCALQCIYRSECRISDMPEYCSVARKKISEGLVIDQLMDREFAKTNGGLCITENRQMQEAGTSYQ